MDSRKSLIFYLLESRLKKSSREGSPAPSGNGQLSEDIQNEDIQNNEEKPESHLLKASGWGQEKQGLYLAQRWPDKEYIYDRIVQKLPERISIITPADEAHQINEQLIDLEGVRLSAENHENHQQKLFKIPLTGLAVKGYFLPPDVINLQGFSKLISFVKLGWGKACPCCYQGEVEGGKPQLWMRLIPGSQHFTCGACGARFLTIGNRGKILFKGSNM
jgi:hypothetical protein